MNVNNECVLFLYRFSFSLKLGAFISSFVVNMSEHENFLMMSRV